MPSLLFSAAGLCLALQIPPATVRGTIWDVETGTPVPGALVALPDLGRRTVTDSTGSYLLREVPPGPQHLVVEVLGYADRELEVFVPTAGELPINIALRPDPIPLPGVEARGQIALPGVESRDTAGSPDKRITMAAVRSHPMLAEADVLQALNGGGVVLDPEAPKGVHVFGGSSDETGYVLDGTPVFSPYHAAGLFGAWNPDALSSIDLYSSQPPLSFPASLSGIVSGSTRTPGVVLRAQGGVSTSNAHLTLDGPLGVGSGGFLLSLRLGFPGGIFRRREPTYLRGEANDGIAKGEAPVLGGRLRVLGYDNGNEIEARGPDTLFVGAPRNVFRWGSRSLGAEWSRGLGGGVFRARSWYASGEGEATWNPLEGDQLRMRALREDVGLTVEIEGRGVDNKTSAGFRVEGIRTAYTVASHAPPRALDGEVTRVVDLGAHTPVAALFFQRTQTLASGTAASLGLDLSYGRNRLWWTPRAEIRWDATPFLSLAGSYARLHQFAQSLRNSESVAGSIFPVDLFLSAESGGVPVGRGGQGILALDLHPAPGLSLRTQAYLKTTENLLLIAPVEREPFLTGDFAVGRGSVEGVAVEGALSGTRYGLLGNYSWQRLRLEHQGSEYAPEWGSAHVFEAGVIVFPVPDLSLRLGGTGSLGRRTTAVEGTLEWESCNLLDQGCEFVGSPRSEEGAPGQTRLPAYFRLDLRAEGRRHFRLGGRDVLVSLFGTFTNLFSRKNLLTFATDPVTGGRVGVEMRPLAPLVFGVDWRF